MVLKLQIGNWRGIIYSHDFRGEDLNFESVDINRSLSYRKKLETLLPYVQFTHPERK